MPHDRPRWRRVARVRLRRLLSPARPHRAGLADLAPVLGDEPAAPRGGPGHPRHAGLRPRRASRTTGPTSTRRSSRWPTRTSPRSSRPTARATRSPTASPTEPPSLSLDPTDRGHQPAADWSPGLTFAPELSMPDRASLGRHDRALRRRSQARPDPRRGHDRPVLRPAGRRTRPSSSAARGGRPPRRRPSRRAWTG